MTAASTTARHEILLEYASMGQPNHCPLGMYVMPSEEDVFRWECVMFIHRGYYASSILRFSLLIPPSYPSTSPSIIFTSPPPFHPLCDPISGSFYLGTRFKFWRPRQDFLFHVLHFVKGAFKRRALDEVREAESLNREAWRLYRDQTPLFSKLASQTAQLSIAPSALYGASASSDSNSNIISFRKLQEGEEETLREKLEEVGKARLVIS